MHVQEDGSVIDNNVWMLIFSLSQTVFIHGIPLASHHGTLKSYITDCSLNELGAFCFRTFGTRFADDPDERVADNLLAIIDERSLTDSTLQMARQEGPRMTDRNGMHGDHVGERRWISWRVPFRDAAECFRFSACKPTSSRPASQSVSRAVSQSVSRMVRDVRQTPIRTSRAPQ